MAPKAWLKSGVGVILNSSGQIVMCEDCPCNCPCPGKTATVTISGAGCPDFNRSWTTAVGTFDGSVCEWVYSDDTWNPVRVVSYYSGGSLYINVLVTETSLSSTMIYQSTYDEAPDCTGATQYNVASNAGSGFCFPGGSTCLVSFGP